MSHSETTVIYDHFAQDYDAAFTHTEIGKRQRQMVHSYIVQQEETFDSVFEVNCGTGEDAIWLARRGKRVTATDISPKMLEAAKIKAAAFPALNLELQELNANQISSMDVADRYDWVFSNFGGLNCLSPEQLRTFLMTSKDHILKENGRIVMVMMSKGCLWETLLFLRKLKFGKAFRRWTDKPLAVNVNGATIATWYYNPSFFKKLKDLFELEYLQTVGFCLPPSYMESSFMARPKLLERLFRLEKLLCRFTFLARFSDHYLIVLRAK